MSVRSAVIAAAAVFGTFLAAAVAFTGGNDNDEYRNASLTAVLSSCSKTPTWAKPVSKGQHHE